MKSNYRKILNLLLTLILCVYFTSCNTSKSGNKNQSSATGWAISGFNSKKAGFKYNTNFKGQDLPPNMVLVEGGTYTKGRV